MATRGYARTRGGQGRRREGRPTVVYVDSPRSRPRGGRSRRGQDWPRVVFSQDQRRQQRSRRGRDPYHPSYGDDSRAGQVSRWTLSRAWTWRRTLSPFYLSFSLWLLGVILYAIGDTTPYVVTALVCLGALVGWWLAKVKRPRRYQMYVWSLYLFVAGWTTASTVVLALPGSLPGGTMIATMLLAFCGFSPFAWLHYRVRGARSKQEEIRIWEELVACPGGALPGSFLMDVRRSDDGWTATVVLPGGFEDSESAIRFQKRIASAYASAYGKRQAISMSSVTLEATDDDRADLLKLSVFKENPVHSKLLYDEASYELVEGCVPMCRFPDRKMGYARLFKPRSGTFPALFCGDIGSGKSRTVDTFLTQSNRTGLVHTWFMDPQGGNSSTAWAGEEGKAKWVARTHRQAYQMIKAAHRVMHARSRANTKMVWHKKDGRRMVGIDFFEPTPERPILQLVIEEAPTLLKEKEFLVLAEEIALMGRKCGIQLVLVAQWPGLEQLGGSNALRTQLKSGTIISMRIGESLGGDLLLPAHILRTANPAKMPKRYPNGEDSAGTCVIDSSAPNSSRGVFGRVIVQEDEDEDPTSVEWAEAASQLSPELEDAAWDAAGPEFQFYRRNGVWPEDAARMHEEQQAQQDQEAVSMTKEPAEAPGPRATVRERILALLDDPYRIREIGVEGKVKLDALARAVDASKQAAWKELAGLVEEGLVAKDGSGYYWLSRDALEL